MVLSFVAAGVLLAGCAEEAPGPQFASDPRPSRTPTEVTQPATPSPGVPAATPVAMATPASLSELIHARGAPGQVFISSADQIWSVASDGTSTLVFETLPGERMLAFDSSPGATQVAVLVETELASQRGVSMIVLDARGEEIFTIDGFMGTAGTPVAGSDAHATFLDWSPQGKKVLVGLGDGSLFSADLVDGAEPIPLDIPVQDAAISNPMWSPTGESVAFVAVNEVKHERVLSVFNIVSGDVTEAVRPLEGRFVVEFAWMPDGVSLLFTEGGDLAGSVAGIDLWRIDANGENRELVASAGTVAPVARIANAAPSPDGRSVAYAVQVPGSGAPRIDSVWVRDLTSGVGFRVPLPPVESIEAIWWTDDGVVVSAVTRGSVQTRRPVLALLRVNSDGKTEVLWAAPIAVATPVSGGVVATPLAS